jgi:dihydroxyacetone kinase-like protein
VPDTITNDQVVAWVRAFAAQVAEQKSALTKLDAAIGDGDHGTNMDRGMRKVLEKLDGAEGDDIGATLKAVGMALVSSVGGASGPLYGTLFMQMGAGAAGATELDLAGWTEALAKGTAGVQARGKAELEDKTMVDALIPAVEALKEHAGDSLADALTASADAAQKGMEATIPLVARKGRASYLGERSADHQDPGATSTHLLIRAAADTLAG